MAGVSEGRGDGGMLLGHEQRPHALTRLLTPSLLHCHCHCRGMATEEVADGGAGP